MSVFAILTAGSRPSVRANPDYFTGTVWQDPIFQAPEPARVQSIRVTFEPGARTNWHTHPLGQTLHVVSGCGWIQKEGAAKEIISAGDSVWIPPAIKHWHGATETSGMVHIAIQEVLDGTAAEWLEPVSDADYLADKSRKRKWSSER